MRKKSQSEVAISTAGGPHRGFDSRTVKRRAERMLSHLALQVELSVALVDDATIHDLNKRFRGIDKSTDVLAFSMREGEPLAMLDGELEVLGDVVISVPTALRQAEERGVPLLAELSMLLAHGLLHLLGYDHRNKKEEREMLRRTKELEQAAASRKQVAG
jgi:probable rRNA maturation factor